MIVHWEMFSKNYLIVQNAPKRGKVTQTQSFLLSISNDSAPNLLCSGDYKNIDQYLIALPNGVNYSNQEFSVFNPVQHEI